MTADKRHCIPCKGGEPFHHIGNISGKVVNQGAPDDGPDIYVYRAVSHAPAAASAADFVEALHKAGILVFGPPEDVRS